MEGSQITTLEVE